ncbi:MAG: helix-turn-helix transcriptional regulator [Phycisphaeraceae bacterium]|nr:helix-turn-helix transcriptional regulator [Phycisphaeraceae bacterium]
MTPLVPLREIDESLVEFNRERYRNELAQGIFEIMRKNRIARTKLADLLGVNKSRISHILSGSKNLQADTLADVLLVLGRTPHLVLATDFDEVRFPVDEGSREFVSVTTIVYTEELEDGQFSAREDFESKKKEERSVHFVQPSRGDFVEASQRRRRATGHEVPAGSSNDMVRWITPYSAWR